LPGSLKIEAVVLRSIRFGEADRILHLYTPQRGRVAAIAKGVRRPRTRFGGRLEPLHRVRLMLYEGRSDLLTVTAAETVRSHARLRNDAQALDAAGRACDAVARLFETEDPHPEVFHLLANLLEALDEDPGRAGAALSLSFRLKLLVAAGIAPRLQSCAACGEREHLGGFSGAAGGVVCDACQAAAFPLADESYDFIVTALGRSLADAPPASELAARQAERAIAETAEHHAGVRLREAAAGLRPRTLAARVRAPRVPANP
jgi:DNA repair protein RecO (recombination protein O)